MSPTAAINAAAPTTFLESESYRPSRAGNRCLLRAILSPKTRPRPRVDAEKRHQPDVMKLSKGTVASRGTRAETAQPGGNGRSDPTSPRTDDDFSLKGGEILSLELSVQPQSSPVGRNPFPGGPRYFH
jgi:hypothetical protein